MKRSYSYFLFLGMIFLTITFSSCTSETKSAEETNSTTTSTDSTKTTDATAKPTGKSPIYGIDISRHQNKEIDDLNKATDSLTFVFCKATGGITYTDPDYKHNWETIAQKGFIRGAYHFYYCKDDPVKQAENFANTVKFEATDLPPVIDFEGHSLGNCKNTPVAEVQATLLKFIQEVEKLTKRKPMIYTNDGVGNKYLNDERFATYPLWIANYTDADVTKPSLAGIWKGTKWLFWQKSQSYETDKMNNDFDLFNGSVKELKAFIENSK